MVNVKFFIASLGSNNRGNVGKALTIVMQIASYFIIAVNPTG